MRNLYALLLVAMSMEDAKSVLGLPSGSEPSHEEVMKAYKAKALENHPDRGGSHEKMVEVNVAKDILEGKQRPTYERGPSSPSGYRPPEPPSGYTYEPRPKRPDNVVTFDEAKNAAGIPSGVDWMFVTEKQRDKGGYSGDESSASNTAFVAYGVTESKHVFVVAMNSYYEAFYVGGGPKTDVWDVRTIDFPRKEGQKIEPAWLAGNVIKALKLVGFEGKFNFKVIPVKGRDWKFDNKTPSGSSMSIKHVLVNLGLVSGDDPSVATRKQVIEMTVSRNYEPGKFDRNYELNLIINGRPFDLSPDETAKFIKMRLGGTPLLEVIFGEYIYDKNPKKVLTRLRKGKIIIQWLAENVKSIPDDATAALLAAAAQMK